MHLKNNSKENSNQGTTWHIPGENMILTRPSMNNRMQIHTTTQNVQFLGDFRRNKALRKPKAYEAQHNTLIMHTNVQTSSGAEGKTMFTRHRTYTKYPYNAHRYCHTKTCKYKGAEGNKALRKPEVHEAQHVHKYLHNANKYCHTNVQILGEPKGIKLLANPKFTRQ